MSVPVGELPLHVKDLILMYLALEGGDFTLFFLAYDHSNGAASSEEKSRTRFLREGDVLISRLNLIHF